LPRLKEVIAPDEVTCGCCSKRHTIGEDVSERQGIAPAQFRLIVTHRPEREVVPLPWTGLRLS
tara:strand:- start:1218 stop:1406 length:189 start_codon:yes stop_codon:yes gene_type:complete